VAVSLGGPEGRRRRLDTRERHRETETQCNSPLMTCLRSALLAPTKISFINCNPPSPSSPTHQVPRPRGPCHAETARSRVQRKRWRAAQHRRAVPLGADPVNMTQYCVGVQARVQHEPQPRCCTSSSLPTPLHPLPHFLQCVPVPASTCGASCSKNTAVDREWNGQGRGGMNKSEGRKGSETQRPGRPQPRPNARRPRHPSGMQMMTVAIRTSGRDATRPDAQQPP